MPRLARGRTKHLRKLTESLPCSELEVRAIFCREQAQQGSFTGLAED
jgi:hypothetical protein